MSSPAQIDITADRRVPYDESFTFLDVDWTGSELRSSARLFKDTTGTALFDDTSPSGVGLIYAGTDTVASHITAGRLTDEIYGLTNPATGNAYAAGDSLALSQLTFFLVFDDFPFPAEPGDDLETWYDVIRVPAGSDPNEMVMRGKLTVRAGVTIP